MKKIVSLLTLCLLIVSALSAKQRTTNEVLLLAKQKLSTLPLTRNVQSQQLSIVPSSQLLPPSATRSARGEAFYLVSASSGFVLISGDDRMRPVIGYSDSHYTHPNNLPPNMLAWFEVYAAEYAYLQSGSNVGASFSDASVRSSSSYPERVDPLVQSTWGQDAPFFNMTPIRDGKQAKTGCVATAMSQIMAYHKHPACGQGTHTYSDKETNITLDFSKAPFEWSKIKMNYAGSSDIGANNAVAHLMYSSAVSISTVFGSGTSESSSISARAALIDYFDYDENTVKFYRKNHFTYRAWVDKMKRELSEKRPILYGGISTKHMGHSFVIDGYDKDELFHVNWGWDGGGSGFFSITTLNPFGGDDNTGGFAVDQDMVIGIQKTTGLGSYQSSFILFGALRLSASQIGRNGSFAVMKNTYVNHGELFYGAVQPILYSKSGEVVALLGTASVHSKIDRSYAIRDVEFKSLVIPSHVPSGEYELHVSVKENSETAWSKVRGEIADGSHYKVKVTNTEVVFIDATNFEGLTLNSFELLRDKIYQNMSLAFKLGIDNVGSEWTGRIGVQILSADGTKKILAQDRIYFHEGMQSIDLYTTYIDEPAGHYKLIPSYSKDGVAWHPLVDAAEVPIEIHPEPRWDQFKLSLDAPPTFKKELPSNEPFELSATIKNTGTGPFDGRVFIRVFVKGVGGVVIEPSMQVVVENGESKRVMFTVPHQLSEREYTLRFMYNYSMFGDRQFDDILYEFSVVAPSQMEQEFAISPSPIEDILEVQTKAPTYGWSIESIGGEKKMGSQSNNVTAHEYTVSVKDLPSGIYILYLYRKAEGKEPKKLKFVKNNP